MALDDFMWSESSLALACMLSLERKHQEEERDGEERGSILLTFLAFTLLHLSHFVHVVLIPETHTNCQVSKLVRACFY